MKNDPGSEKKPHEPSRFVEEDARGLIIDNSEAEGEPLDFDFPPEETNPKAK